MPDLYLQLSDDPFDGPAEIPALSEDEALEVLAEGEFVGSKLIPWGSNYSFAVAILDAAGREQLAIYKPRDGENPLYDFPHGTLYLREVAAYRLSRLLRWKSCRRPSCAMAQWASAACGCTRRPSSGLDRMCDPREFWSRREIEVERLVLFDHVRTTRIVSSPTALWTRPRWIWGIDHGLCFNADTKLRTVLWQFVGTSP